MNVPLGLHQTAYLLMFDVALFVHFLIMVSSHAFYYN